MSAVRSGETVQDGRVIPEAEVVRDDRGAASFQVREAVTVRQGFRGRKSAEKESLPPGKSFNVREAVTVELPPPHWAALTQQEELSHVPHSGPDTDSGKD